MAHALTFAPNRRMSAPATSGLATLRQAALQWLEQRRTRATLRRLDPRLLRDAGLDEASIVELAGEPWERQGVPGFMLLALRERP